MIERAAAEQPQRFEQGVGRVGIDLLEHPNHDLSRAVGIVGEENWSEPPLPQGRAHAVRTEGVRIGVEERT
jgi:hypothetical protein